MRFINTPLSLLLTCDSNSYPYSLLTLSRVIAALGSPSRSHVNFRDSKLTRILQPSLSGNARMAIICCATPSEMYLEETRSTLQFASRAKLVKTNAQINEVLDDRSMIKKLQRELADAKRAANGEVDMRQIRELESEAAKAENNAKRVQEKYERLKASILKGGIFPNSKSKGEAGSLSSDGIHSLRSPQLLSNKERKRRRRSDGVVARYIGSPLLDITNRKEALTTMTPALKRDRKDEEMSFRSSTSGRFQVALLKEALATKGEIAQKLEKNLLEWQTTAQQYESSLFGARQEIGDLKEENVSSQAANESLMQEKEALELQRQGIVEKSTAQLEEKETAISEALRNIEQILSEKESLNERIASLEATIADRDTKINVLQDSLTAKEEDVLRLETTNAEIDQKVNQQNESIQDLRGTLSMKETQMEELNTDIMRIQNENLSLSEQISSQNQTFSLQIENLENKLAENAKVVDDVTMEKVRLSFDVAKTNEQNETLMKENMDLNRQLSCFKSIIAQLRDDISDGKRLNRDLIEKAQLEETVSAEMSAAEDSAMIEIQGLAVQLDEINTELEDAKCQLSTYAREADDLAENKELAEALASQMSAAEDSALAEIEGLVDQLSDMQHELDDTKAELASAEGAKYDAENLALERKATLDKCIMESESIQNELMSTRSKLDSVLKSKSDTDSLLSNGEIHVGNLNNRIDGLEREKCNMQASLDRQIEQNQALMNELEHNKSLITTSSDNHDKTIQELKATISAMEDDLSFKTKTESSLTETIRNLKSSLEEMEMNYNIEIQKAKDANTELLVAKKELAELMKAEKDRAQSVTDDSALINQVSELQQLLSSANTREEETRNLLLTTNQELQQKEMSLLETSNYVSECEAAIKELEQKIVTMEQCSSTSNTHGDQEELLKEMELLLDEKENLQLQLEETISERDNTEKILKQRFGDEQRQLVQRGEAMMGKLREELSVTRAELENHKKDAQTTRQDYIALEERMKSDQSAAIDADEKVLQLSEKLSKAEEVASRYKAEIQNLKEEIEIVREHMNSSKESFKQSYEKKLAHAKDEVATLRESLHNETSTANSCREKIKLYEENIMRLEVDMASTKKHLLSEKDYEVRKAKEGQAKLKVDLSRAQADIFSLKQEVEDYRDQMKKLKQKSLTNDTSALNSDKYKQLEASIRGKDIEISAFADKLSKYEDRVSELTQGIKELKAKVKSKDDRIAELDAKRLTKQHIAIIQNLKVRGFRLIYTYFFSELLNHSTSILFVD